MVLDEGDQPLLSMKMRNVLTGIWKRSLIATTRREKKEICQCVNLKTSFCVEVSPFSIDEQKRFS